MKQSLLIVCLISLAIVLSARIINPDKPIKGNWDLGLKPLWQTDSAGERLIGEIQNLTILSEGQVAILDNKEAVVHIFSAQGKHLTTFGKRGEGPGEFKTLRRGRQLFFAGNQILFFDETRLQRFNLLGTFISQDQIAGRLRPSAFIDENRFVSAPATADDPKAEILVELFDLKKNESKILTKFQPYNKATATEQSGRQAITVAIVISDITPLMTVSANQNRIVYGLSDQYQLTLIDYNGKSIGSFSIPDRKAKQVGKAFKEALKKRIGSNAPVEMVNRIVDGLPPIASFFSGLQILDNGMILAFISDPDRDTGLAIDIFSPTGEFLYQAEVSAPEGHTIENMILNSNRLFLSTLDEEGSPCLSAYQIRFPEK